MTYIPHTSHFASYGKINQHLGELETSIERPFPGIHVVHKSEVWKLQCTHDGATVKIEVNGTKRGILGEVEIMELCSESEGRVSSQL